MKKQVKTLAELRDWLIDHDACDKAMEWFDEQVNSGTALEHDHIWWNCPRPDWLTWWSFYSKNYPLYDGRPFRTGWTLHLVRTTNAMLAAAAERSCNASARNEAVLLDFLRTGMRRVGRTDPNYALQRLCEQADEILDDIDYRNKTEEGSKREIKALDNSLAHHVNEILWEGARYFRSCVEPPTEELHPRLDRHAVDDPDEG